MKPDEARDLLCAADVYVRPFGQSATTQTSLCCRCAIIVQDSPSHRALDCDNGFLTDEKRRLAEAYQYLVSHVDRLVAMRAASGEFARMNLDYRMLAQRVCT